MKDNIIKTNVATIFTKPSNDPRLEVLGQVPAIILLAIKSQHHTDENILLYISSYKPHYTEVVVYVLFVEEKRFKPVGLL